MKARYDIGNFDTAVCKKLTSRCVDTTACQLIALLVSCYFFTEYSKLCENGSAISFLMAVAVAR